MAAASVAACTVAAHGDPIQNYAVFGNTGVVYEGFSTTVGAVGSNGDIDLLSASTTISSLSALGNFNGSGDFQTVTGSMDFNGNVIGGPLSSYGSIDAGGSVSLQGNVTGNITAGNDLSLSTFNTVGGNALAGGNATLNGANTITGSLSVNGNVTLGNFETINNLIYGGTLTTGVSANISSQSHTTVSVHPRLAVYVPIPTASSFTSGGPDETLPLFANVTLAPGHYGALTFNGSNNLTLTSGNYYFNSIQSIGEFTTLNYNLSNGPINIYVTGSVDLLAVGENINGKSFSTADPTLASQVYLESYGPVIFDNVSPANGSTFFGTIFSPFSSITMGVNETVIGSLLSDQTVTLGGTNVTYEPSIQVSALPVPVPEPTSTALFAITGGLLLSRRRRR